MLLEHERTYGLGMDAAVSVCSWNTNGIMVWACMPQIAAGSTTLRTRFRAEGAQNLRPKRQRHMASAGYSTCGFLRCNVWAEG